MRYRDRFLPAVCSDGGFMMNLQEPETSFAGGGVHLVVVPVDYTENSPALPDELRGHAAKNGGQS
jgi:hypothetical protein